MLRCRKVVSCNKFFPGDGVSILTVVCSSACLTADGQTAASAADSATPSDDDYEEMSIDTIINGQVRRCAATLVITAKLPSSSRDKALSTGFDNSAAFQP